MTSDEFREWFDRHVAAFTGITKWLSDATKGENAPSRKQVLASWARTLEDCDLSAAKAATDAMARGELEEPKGYDRHPAAIRAACGKNRGLRKKPYEVERFENDDPDHGARLYCCLMCLDEGAVICWHQQNIRDVLDGTFATKRISGKSFRLYSQAVPCTCQAGRDRFLKSPVRFDPERALPLNRIEGRRVVMGHISDTAERERLIHWVQEVYVPAAQRRCESRQDLAAPPPEYSELETARMF